MGKLQSHMQKYKSLHQIRAYTKINSKWIEDLTLRPEIVKLIILKSKVVNSHDIGFGNNILNLTHKAKAKKVKIHMWICITLKNFCITGKSLIEL